MNGAFLIRISAFSGNPAIAYPSAQSAALPFVTRIVNSSESENTIGLDRIENAQMGVIINTGTSGVSIAPPAEREYAVEPVGVQIKSPSPETTFRPSFVSTDKRSICVDFAAYSPESR